MSVIAFVCFNLLLWQTIATFILLRNFIDKLGRRYRIIPTVPHLGLIGKVSVIIIPAGDDKNIYRLLAGISRQSYEVREILVLATRDCFKNENIKVLSEKDPRIRFLDVNNGMLDSGLYNVSRRSEWVLVVRGGDYIHKNLASSVLSFALKQNCEVVYLLPKFILRRGWKDLPLALWLSGWYTLGGGIANYCVLLKRQLSQSSNNNKILGKGNYRQVVADGSDLVKINIFGGLKDYNRGLVLEMGYCQCVFSILVQTLPLPLLLTLTGLWLYHHYDFLTFRLLFFLNFFLFILRLVIQTAVIPAIQFPEEKINIWFFFPPFADILATIQWFFPLNLNAPKTDVFW
ncbi:MAG: hypothetical protein NZ901_10425 [Geminocystis sp.]|nr:hypothetical protein [Geminocystis sp.]HIK38732.1 hypothetical protein [Geminocystis sp. M7585_C2015_104]MCS7148590.1 hypothetical protein [Geminocystis sp.]MCX8078147.1 hypothetical protein [Geminocystis sp.]MDW8115018.1 hypothetical protein [Geminocystis sp.]